MQLLLRLNMCGLSPLLQGHRAVNRNLEFLGARGELVMPELGALQIQCEILHQHPSRLALKGGQGGHALQVLPDVPPLSVEECPQEVVDGPKVGLQLPLGGVAL